MDIMNCKNWIVLVFADVTSMQSEPFIYHVKLPKIIVLYSFY